MARSNNSPKAKSGRLWLVNCASNPIRLDDLASRRADCKSAMRERELPIAKRSLALAAPENIFPSKRSKS